MVYEILVGGVIFSKSSPLIVDYSMLKILSIALLAASASAGLMNVDRTRFVDFVKANHPGLVQGSAEWTERLALFEESVARIRAHNAKSSTYKMGLNKFSASTALGMGPMRDEGIRNLGNTCYIGSVLQAILGQSAMLTDCLSPLWSHIIRKHYTKEDNNTSIHSVSSNSNNSGSSSSNSDIGKMNSPIVIELDDDFVASDSTSTGGHTSVEKASANSSNAKTSKSMDAPAFAHQSVLSNFYDICKYIQQAYFETGTKSQQKNVQDVKHFKRAIDSQTDLFIGYGQQDAHEFYSFFINCLHEEFEAFLKHSIIKFISSARANSKNLNTSVTVNVSNGMNQENNTTVVKSLFPGTPGASIADDGAITSAESTPVSNKFDTSNFKLTSSLASFLPTTRSFHLETQMCVTCSVCSTVSTKRSEFFRELSLGLEEKVVHSGTSESDTNKENNEWGVLGSTRELTMNKLLETYFADQQRDFCCEDCQDHKRTLFPNNKDSQSPSNSRAIVSSRIHALPQILVFHLKRFKYDGTKN